jgi:hypothetical protein
MRIGLERALQQPHCGATSHDQALHGCTSVTPETGGRLHPVAVDINAEL